MRPQDFYTRTRSSRGVRAELADPDGNREWVLVRSVLSAEFVAVAAAVARRAERYRALIDSAGPVERKRLGRMRRATLASALVAEWSLPIKTPAEVADLLAINPRLRRQIERISENHALHFGVAE
ncbi:hypothetical protein MCB86_08760 [Pseudomonas sp. KSR10]|uniref:hypothetical protein n=1 Tax=Pseudomonas sp. KSR10 TaxID=2916654 RepID=UPI001EF76938|nr:hypothetical protein [Pseudomonas sp. KSR10]MCG6540165.1 hypothetical protein [Pseudomonas sp. KSR10]